MRKYLLKFRTLNRKLLVERARWRHIPRNEKKSFMCKHIGDEYHNLMFLRLITLRKKYLASNYCNRPYALKFEKLMKSKNPTVLRKLCLFIKGILNCCAYPSQPIGMVDAVILCTVN